jgi:hypothetical protein
MVTLTRLQNITAPTEPRADTLPEQASGIDMSIRFRVKATGTFVRVGTASTLKQRFGWATCLIRGIKPPCSGAFPNARSLWKDRGLFSKWHCAGELVLD